MKRLARGHLVGGRMVPTVIVAGLPGATPHYLCVAAGCGTTYSGNVVGGAPCTIVYAYSTPMPYAPQWIFTMSMTSSYVSRAAQSRCHSSITDNDVTGFAPAWITRFMAFSCASWLTAPQQSSTIWTS